PADRYPTPAEAAAALEPFASVPADGRPGNPPPAARRRRRLLTGAAAAAGLALLAVVAWFGRRHPDPTPRVPAPEHPGPQAPPPAGPASVPLLVRHYRGDPPVDQGAIGDTSFAAQDDDDVRVEAALPGPMHCFLIAYNTDGAEQLCYPGDPTDAPPAAAEVRFPFSPTKYLALTDGAGLQAFALVGSRRPLPAFERWRAGAGAARWEKSAESALAWRLAGPGLEPLEPLVRGAVRERGVPPRGLEALTRFLRERRDVDVVGVVAFPVKPKTGEK